MIITNKISSQSPATAVSRRRTPDKCVTRCLNLRPDALTRGTLRPAGVPRIIAPRDWEPLVTDGDRLYVCNGNTLAWLTLTADGGLQQPVAIATLPSAPRCAVVAAGTVTVMLPEGPYYVTTDADGVPQDCVCAPQWPQVSLTARFGGLFSRNVEADTAEKIGAAAVDAAAGLTAQAAAAGLFLHPVIARCRFTDAHGNTLHLTPPVAVMLPCGAQLTEALRSPVTDLTNMTVRAFDIEVQGFAIDVRIAGEVPAYWRQRVAAMTVEVSRELGPDLSADGGATVTINRRATEGAEAVITMPGTEAALTASHPSSSRAIVANILADASSALTPALTVAMPFATDGPFTVIAGSRSTAAKTAKSNSADAKNTFAAPHTFTAAFGSSDGRVTLWGNPARISFGGYGAGHFAVTVGATDGPWSGRVRIDFADGRHVVTSVIGSARPLTLSPLLSYPDASARRITLTVSNSDGSVSGWSADLVPDPSQTFAYCLHPSLLPFALGDEFDEPGEENVLTDDALRGHVAVADAAAPGSVVAVHRVADRLVTLRPAVSSGGAWEFGRPRFYAFCSDAVRLLTLSADLGTAAVNLFDNRRVTAPGAVTAGDSSVIAVASGRLVQIRGTRVSTVADMPDFDGTAPGVRAGYDAEAAEVIVANPDDNEAVVFTAGGGHYFLTLEVSDDNIVQRRWLAEGGRIFAVTNLGLAEVSRRNMAADVAVGWSCTLTPQECGAVIWNVKTPKFSGLLSVYRKYLTNNSPTPALMQRLKVEGALRSPLSVRLAPTRMPHRLVLELQGTVSAAFRMTAPAVTAAAAAAATR